MYATVLVLLTAAVVSASVEAEPSITIGDTQFLLANAVPPEQPLLREYVPAGQTLDDWERLASVRIFKDLKDPRAYLDKLGNQVVHSHPAARAQLLQSDDRKGYVLDFMMFPPDSTRPFYAEWSLARAAYVEGKGLVVYQYSVRIYKVGPETGPIVQAERVKMLKPFEAATFEEKEIQTQ